MLFKSIYNKKRALLKEKEAYLKMRESLIDAMQKELDRKCESLLGPTASEAKREILLRHMKSKWKAEAEMLSVQTDKILASIDSQQKIIAPRIEELKQAIAQAEKRTSTESNRALLSEYRIRLNEIQQVERSVNATKTI